MIEFQALGTQDGFLHLGVGGREKLRQFLKACPPQGIRMVLRAELPESNKLRRYYEGCVVPLVTFYQEGLDHRDSEDRRKVREWLKEEFNGEFVMIGGEMRRVAKSSKGRDALNPLVERVCDWLRENYAVPEEALDPTRYKEWRDTVFPFGGPSTYIDYLC